MSDLPMPELTFSIPVMPIINGIIGGAVAMLVGILIRRRQQRVFQPGLLCYDRTLKICFALAFPLIMVMNLTASRAEGEQRVYALMLMIPFTAGLLFALAELFGRRIRWDNSTITFENAWKKARTIRWAEIVGYRYLPRRSAHELTTMEGDRFLIGTFLTGFPPFRKRLRRHFETIFPERFAVERFSYQNEELIAESERCGCAHCLAIYDTSEVKDWLSVIEPRTALCPRCGMDRVIPDASDYPVTPASLEKARSAIIAVLPRS